MDFATDFELQEIVIESVNGTEWDVSLLMGELNVYEDLNNSTISADVVLDDADNKIKSMPITGHEWIRIAFKTPGKGLIKLHLRIYKISARELEKERRQLYILHCVDQVEFTNAKVRVSKAYKQKLISDIAKNVQEEFLGSSFNTIETTKNICHIIPGYWSPLKTLNFLAHRANSGQYQGANYLYFQTADGFNFTSVEKLVDTKPAALYLYQPANIRQQDVATGYKPRTIAADSIAIQSYKFINNFDTLENVSQGMYGSRILVHDIQNKSFEEVDFDYAGSYTKYKHVEPNSVKGGQSFLWTSQSDFSSAYGAFKVMPKGLPKQENYGQQWLSQRLSQMQQIQNVRMFCTVPGDSDRRAGHVVSITLPSAEPLVDNQLQIDDYYTGRYLVSGVRHMVNKKSYTTILELVKDSVFTAYP